MRLTTEEKSQLVMRYQAGESVASICADTGIARSTLYSWIKSFHVVKSRRGMQVTPHDYDVLKKRVEKLEGIVQVLKAANCTVSAPLQDKLAALESLYGQFSVHTLCDALEVPRGTFYNHILRRKGTNARGKGQQKLCDDPYAGDGSEEHQPFRQKRLSAPLRKPAEAQHSETEFLRRAYESDMGQRHHLLQTQGKEVLYRHHHGPFLP